MYWRTTPPCRDWAGTANETENETFDFARADYHSPHAGAIMGDCEEVARRFFWLSGERFPSRLLGAQGWPLTRPASVDAAWGAPGLRAPAAVVEPGYVSESVPPALLVQEQGQRERQSRL